MCKKITLSVLVISALVGMTGCGGGSTPDEVDTGITSTEISGVAVDDLIFNGLVTAKKADGSELVKGRTSETDGTYTLNVEHDGVMLLNVTCDENSTMGLTSTDAVGCADQGVSLNSLADVEPGVAQTVNISPLSEIVYQAAVESAAGDPISEDNFVEARSDIGAMLGVDPIADNPTEGIYAQIIDVIHTIAEENNTTVIAVTTALAEALSDGEAEGEDEVVEFTEAMVDANLTNPLTDNNGTFTPIPTEILTDIEEAKALFTELRTQAMSVVDYNNSGTPGFLDGEVQDMDTALNDVVMNIGFMGSMFNMLSDAIGYAEDTNQTQLSGGLVGSSRLVSITKDAVGSWSYEITQVDSTGTWSGTVSYPEITDSIALTFTTLSATIDGTLPLDYEPVVEADVIDSQSFNGTFNLTKTTSGADISISGSVASNGTSITLSNTTAEVAYEAETDAGNQEYTKFNYLKLHGMTLQGIVGGYTIDGSLTVNNYVQNTLLAPKGGFEETVNSYVGGQINCYDTNYNNVGYYANAVVRVTTLDGVEHTFYTDSNGWYGGEIEGSYDINDFENVLSTGYALDSTVCPVGSTASASVYWVDSWSDEEIANSGWLPDDITFAGAISRTGAAMEGTLNAKWLNATTIDVDSNATPLVNVTFNGKLQMPERPEMLATLTFENNATNYTLGASYTYDTTVINMSALFDSEMDNGDVEVTTHTGLRADLKITDGNLVTDGTGTVTKDGSLVGTLENREDVPVIKYVDGSFESLP